MKPDEDLTARVRSFNRTVTQRVGALSDHYLARDRPLGASLARLHGEPVGCGALKFHGTEPAELKRMWVANRARGLGLGRRLLAELEDQARRHGATVVRLETNHALTEAITLYRSAGYAEVSAFSDEQYAHHWFEKRLDGS